MKNTCTVAVSLCIGLILEIHTHTNQKSSPAHSWLIIYGSPQCPHTGGDGNIWARLPADLPSWYQMTSFPVLTARAGFRCHEVRVYGIFFFLTKGKQWNLITYSGHMAQKQALTTMRRIALIKPHTQGKFGAKSFWLTVKPKYAQRSSESCWGITNRVRLKSWTAGHVGLLESSRSMATARF